MLIDETAATKKAIQDSPLFAGLEEADRVMLAAIARAHAVAAGQQIFTLGSDATTILLVERGTVALTLPLRIRGAVTDVTLEEMGAGAAIGWSALVPPYRYTLGARALTDARLIGLERETLEELFGRLPRVQRVLMTNLSRVVASRVTLLEAVLLRNVQRWVAEKCA